MRYLVVKNYIPDKWDFYGEIENGLSILCNGFYDTIEELARDIVSGDVVYGSGATDFNLEDTQRRMEEPPTVMSATIMTHAQLTILAL
jgi:hypothetical protein